MIARGLVSEPDPDMDIRTARRHSVGGLIRQGGTMVAVRPVPRGIFALPSSGLWTTAPVASDGQPDDCAGLACRSPMRSRVIDDLFIAREIGAREPRLYSRDRTYCFRQDIFQLWLSTRSIAPWPRSGSLNETGWTRQAREDQRTLRAAAQRRSGMTLRQSVLARSL